MSRLLAVVLWVACLGEMAQALWILGPFDPAWPTEGAWLTLATARNAAIHGVWGIDATGFSQGASSLSWTWILATLQRIGFGVHAPLAAGLGAAMAFVLTAWRTTRASLDPASAWVVVALAWLLAPLGGAVATGSSLALVAFVGLVFVDHGIGWLSESRRRSPSLIWATLAGATDPALVVAGFLVALALAWRRRLADAGTLAVALLATPLLYAAYAMSAGEPLVSFDAIPTGALLAVGAVLATRQAPRMPGRLIPLAVIVVVALGVARTRHAHADLQESVQRMRTLEMPVARFVAASFPDRIIAASPMGAIGWHSHGNLVDLSGKANPTVARHLAAGTLSADVVAAEAGHADVIVLSQHWMRGDFLPTTWRAPAVLERRGTASARTFVCPSPSACTHLQQVIATTMPPDELELVTSREEVVPGASLTVVEGVLEANEDAGSLAFYTNGTARGTAPRDGTLSVVTHGTTARGRGPEFVVACGGRAFQLAAPLEPSRSEPLCELRRGEAFEMVYEDDLVDEDGNDRNLFVDALVIETKGVR